MRLKPTGSHYLFPNLRLLVKQRNWLWRDLVFPHTSNYSILIFSFISLKDSKLQISQEQKVGKIVLMLF